MTDRQRLIEKIAALRAKTRAAGCTEAEALAAAELAARLMREHGMSDDDLDIATCSSETRGGRSVSWRSVIAVAIRDCTNSACITDLDGRRIFVGTGAGPEIAAYLYDVLVRAVERARRVFRESREYRRLRSDKSRENAKSDFCLGMAVRLAQRVRELFYGSANEAARERALVARDRLFPHRQDAKGQLEVKGGNRPHYGAGAAAAEGVTIAHGVKGERLAGLLAGGAP